jgi:hypothetical protein
MPKKQKMSSFDLLVDKLISDFSKIPNFSLVLTDPAAKEVFNMTMFRISELVSYKELTCQHFIPATNRAIFESRRDFLSSKYNTIVDINCIDFSETLYDIIRLAYVGLFHKVENFVNEIIKMVDIISNDSGHVSESIYQWAKREFNFDFKDWHCFPVIFKINWICNCVKHKDGFPLKTPIPEEFEDIDLTERIKVFPDEFKEDCNLVIKYYQAYLQLIFSLH